MKEIRVGIIGCGIIAQAHLESYAKMQDVTIVAICDIDKKALETTGQKFSVKHLYTDYREMLKRDDMDAVDICQHNNLHAPITCEVLQKGFHAYCEKPMAGSWLDAKAMLDVAKAQDKMLHIQISLLYAPETRAAKKLIDAGRLGHIYYVSSRGFRRRGRPFVDGYAVKEFNSKAIAAGGALFDMGVYHITQLLYLLDRPQLQKVSGQIYQELDMDEQRQQIGRFDVEELGVGFARYENGLTFDLIESWAIHMNDFGGSFIAGSLGGVRLDPFSFHSFQNDMIMDTTTDMVSDEYRNHQLNPIGRAYDDSQSHWIAALRNEIPLLPTAEIALDCMLLSEGIYLSSFLSREVTADEIKAMSKSIALGQQDTPTGVITYKPYPFT